MSNVLAMAMAALLSVESSGGRDVRPADSRQSAGPFQMKRIAVDENSIEGS